jgi:PAS domain S-box-containing protein
VQSTQPDLFRSIAESSADAIFTTDIDGRLTYYSPGAEDLLGYQAQEVLGRRGAAVYRGGFAEARSIMQRLRAEGRIKNYETAIQAKDGHWVEVSSSLSLLRNATGAVVGTLAICKDITERKHAEAALRASEARYRQAKDAAELANRAKSEFLANMSHELRTPLNAIIGFSEVLLEKMCGDLNARQEEYLHDILSSGNSLLSLINDILDLTRIEAGTQELLLSECDLPQLLEGSLGLIKERALAHNLTLSLEVDQALGTLCIDPRKVKQILFHLLSNAVKFTPAGGTVGVKATRLAHAACIAVWDTGIGIAAEEQQRIFEAFQQVGQGFTGKTEGTGLGLTLTRKFVELHGGTIWVKSTAGGGSTFTFTLPLSRAVPEP